MAVKFNPISGQFDLVGGGGAAGGLPVGGVQYDLLVKNSGTDYDAIWSRTLDTLTVNGILTAPDVHGSLNGPIYVYGKNTSASLIAKGTPVYVTGSVGASGQVEIGPADASNSAKMPAIGLTRADVAVNAFVDVVILGVVEQLNTSAYAINSPVYVAPGGGITSTRPTASTDLVQNIGRVDRVNASTGIIVVLGPGRTNDIPNLAAGTVFIGSDRRALTVSDITGLDLDYLSDWVSPNNYIGKAPAGSATSASVWTVRKITVSSGGAVTFYGTATPIKWTDRYTAVYT
jgi:hypothetical protein